MIALVQRVRQARVEVAGEVVGRIERGLLILLGIHREDTGVEAQWLARKCAYLRIFSDELGKMNRSLLDIEGEALVVSQFTLYGDAIRGHRPSFVEAAPPDKARALYETFIQYLEGFLGRSVATGVFGAMMDVHLINEGPVTLIIERKPLLKE